MDDLVINSDLTIPAEFLELEFSRSSGPGGQNVNKLNTRVCVLLDIPNCPVLSEIQKEKLAVSLRRRVDKNGVFRVVCQRFRSQHANRNGALERMAELIAEALKPVPVRRKTRIRRSAIEKRLQTKKQQSEKKRFRKKRIDY
jgi:ribosome-associated protein